MAELAGAHHAERHICTCSAISEADATCETERERKKCATREVERSPTCAGSSCVSIRDYFNKLSWYTHASAARAWASRETSPLFINRFPTLPIYLSFFFSLSLSAPSYTNEYDRNKNVFRMLGRLPPCTSTCSARRPQHA